MATTKKASKPRLSAEQAQAILKGKSGAGEPTVTKDKYREQLGRALNWYNANWDAADYEKAAVAYVRHLKMTTYLNAIQKSSPLEIRSIGVIGRLIMRGEHVELNDVEKILIQLEKLKVKVDLGVKAKISPVDPKSKGVLPKQVVVQPVLGIQERIMENARKLAADVDGAIDEYITNGTEFSMKSFLLGNHVSGVVAKKVGEMYVRTLAELDEAVLGKDAQLKEGYAHLGKRKLKAFAEFIRSIIADCNQQVVSAKAQRKPTVRKPKAPSVIAKKMVYMKEFPALKLKSVPAEKIVGATELWAYNTVTRKLSVFYGADGGFLTVSGMSVANYDVAKSEVKTLRKPEDFFKGLSSTGKRAMANAFKAIKSKASEPRSRINADTILLAVN